MTRLLVSVRSTREAQTVLQTDAHLIDIKEPSRGSLGRSDWSTIREIAVQVDRQRPMSIALGELVEWPGHDAIDIPTSVEFVKFGLSGCMALRNWRSHWREAVCQLTPARPVAVHYADHQSCESPPFEEILEFGAEIGCAVMLWDTYEKSRGNLLTYVASSQLQDQLRQARQYGLATAVAGSLTVKLIERLAPLSPDIFAVRGAACGQNRRGNIDAGAIRELSQSINRIASMPGFGENRCPICQVLGEHQ